METSDSLFGSTPNTATDTVRPFATNNPSPWFKGATPTIERFLMSFSVIGSKSDRAVSNSSNACGTVPRIRVRNSRSKPFNTDRTRIKTATPNVNPAIETAEMNEIKWFRRFARVYRRPMQTDNGLNITQV